MAKMSREEFVNGTLAETIKAAFEYVDFVEYDDGVEMVRVIFKDGYGRNVNVACDSHAAIISDVIKALL